MSGIGPAGGGQNPFEGIFGDLARLLGGASSGPLNWDVARQVSGLIAADGATEPNVNPIDRIRLESIVRVAELHVGQVTGMDVNIRSVEAINHTEWASVTLNAWKDILEALAQSLSRKPGDTLPPMPDGVPTDMFAQLASMEQWMGPVLLGMQAGGMVGQLSRRTLGLFDLPIPRSTTDTVVLVPSNIDVFAEEWSLPLDELSLYVSIEEVTRLAVLARPHVAARFTSLISEYVSNFQPDSSALQDRLSGFDMSDPTNLPEALNDPQTLLGAITTPAQTQTLAKISALVAAFVGYVDWVVSQVAPKTMTAHHAIAEAAKRRRVEETDGNRLVEQLLGLELSQPAFDRGDAFVRGVLERAGEDGLARLWRSERELPTPAEVDAPGLWLERIDLPSFDEGAD